MNLDKLKALAAGKKTEMAARSNFNDIKKPPQGKSKWRILPGWREGEEEVYFHEFGQHWIKDNDGSVLAVFVCEQRTFGRPCEICETINNEIRSTKDDDTAKKLKDMKVRSQFLVNAVRLDGSEANPKKAVLLSLPATAYTQFNDTLNEYLTEHSMNVLDAKAGRSITIERTGTGQQNTKYQVLFDPANTAVPAEALGTMINIDQYIEGERVKGLQKGLDQIGKAASSIKGVAYTPKIRTELPKLERVARPAAASRVIEEDVVEGEVMEEVSKKTSKKIDPVTIEKESNPFSPDQLEEMLRSLDE